MGNLAKAKYVIVLLVMFVLGVGLMVVAAFWGTSVEAGSATLLLQKMREMTPNLTADKQQSLAIFLTDWQAHFATESFWLIIVRDLGIAIIVALILTVVIENYARQKFLEEMRTGIVEAVFQRLIPPSIFAELRSQVIGAMSVRRDWQLRMTILPSNLIEPKEDSYLLCRTTLSYKIFNNTSHAHLEMVRSWLDEDYKGKDSEGALPRYERVTIGNETFEGDNLRRMLGDDQCSYETTRLLPRGENEYLQVVNEIKQIIRVPDAFVWNMTAPTEKAEITIDTTLAPDVGFKIKALHPDRKRLVESPIGRWAFDGGFLPWWGFEIHSFYRDRAYHQRGAAATGHGERLDRAEGSGWAAPSGAAQPASRFSR